MRRLSFIESHRGFESVFNLSMYFAHRSLLNKRSSHMKFQFYKGIQNQIFKVLTIVLTCSLLVFSNVSPALAFERSGSGSSSDPSQGAAVLDNLKGESEDAMSDGLNSMEKTQRKAQEGPNEVQGGADLDKMYNSDNSDDSKDAVSVRKQIENALENASPGR